VSQPPSRSDDAPTAPSVGPGPGAATGAGAGASAPVGAVDNLPVLEGYLGHSFRDRELLRTALRHKSFVNERGAGLAHNERLEFLGDAVLQLVVTHMLMEAGPQHSEGELSLWRSQVVSEAQLAQLATAMSLGQFLALGRGEEQSGGRSKPSLLADAYEAVIGALYLDTDFAYVLRLMRRLIGPLLASVLSRGATDYKSALQELLQRREKIRPRYEVVDTSGPEHEKTFAVAVYCNETLLGQAVGRSKRDAEHRAAAVALTRLQEAEAAAGGGGRAIAINKAAPLPETTAAEPPADAARSSGPR
jgi:ribonuclease-3